MTINQSYLPMIISGAVDDWLLLLDRKRCFTFSNDPLFGAGLSCKEKESYI